MGKVEGERREEKGEREMVFFYLLKYLHGYRKFSMRLCKFRVFVRGIF
jgi:hypothetical protein